MMAVNINERELRALNLVFFDDERGFGLVLLDGQRWLRLLLRHRRPWPQEERTANE